MPSLLYRDYLIVASADFDEVTGRWTPSVIVTWNENGAQKLQTLDSLPIAFFRQSDAEMFGTERAKAWIDAQASTFTLTPDS
jgi:hypothetical protein